MNYESMVGRPRGEVTTPALLLDLDAVRRNIARMAEAMDKVPAQLRPHIKVHKSPQVSHLQVEAGANGICTATAWEAAAMVQHGIKDVLVANQVVGPEKTRVLAEAARDAHVSSAVDSAVNAQELSGAAQAAGSQLGVLIEVDVGMRRSGVRSKEDAVRLAQVVSSLPGLRLEGVQGYEGHCMLEPDRQLRVEKAQAATQYLLETVDFVEAAGFPCPVISGGGTGTYDITGRNPRVTELQAGSYVFMDAFHGSLIPGFEEALTVLASVVSRQGDRVILDSGLKTVGADLMLPRVRGVEATTASIAEEHLLVDLAPGSSLRVGDTVEVVPGYGPTTVNLHEVYFVVEEGSVVDIWPVLARGSGQGERRV